MSYDKETCVRMFKHGCAFAECGKHCEVEPINSEQMAGSFTIAGIVNSAFACEIFLKTLLAISSTKAKGHKLSYLWKNLEKQNPSLSIEIKQRIQMSFFTEDSQFLDEMLAIDTISDTYCHWRYIYEDEKSSQLRMNRNFIRIFRVVLQEICCETLFGCSWAEYYTQKQ